MTEPIEKKLLKKIISYIGKNELKNYLKISKTNTILNFFHIWLSILVSFFLISVLYEQALFLQIILTPILIVFIGTRINAIGVQIHEASHYLIWDNKRKNDLIMDYFGSYWVLNDIKSYRQIHLVHHTDLNTPKDPDISLYTIKKGKSAKIIRIINDLFFISALSRIMAYLKSTFILNNYKNRKENNSKIQKLVLKFLFQAILIFGFVLFFGLELGLITYFLFWLIPLFCIFPIIITLRICAEHYSNNPGNREFIARTTLTNKLESYLLGASMEYHFEHHLIMSIPHHQLKKLHHDLTIKGFYDDLPKNKFSNSSYIGFWRRLYNEN